MKKEIVVIDGKEYDVYVTTNNKYGHPRYVVYYLNIGLDEYVPVKGISKYRGKDFGGGYVFATFTLEVTLKKILDTVKNMQK